MSSKEKPTKRGFGIIAISKKKKKKKTSGAGVEDRKTSVTSVGAESITEVETIDFASSEGMEEVSELTKQLEEARADLDAAEGKIDKDSVQIQKLEEQLKQAQEETKKLQGKVGEYEKISGDLDDDSYSAAQEFQLKQKVDKLQTELDKRKHLEQELIDTKVELQEVKSNYEEVQYKQTQSTTRSKIKSLTEEKITRDEVLKLQKELRAMEHKLKYEMSTFEAQLKAGQDSLQRAQEKAKTIQKRFDEVEKERLDLKITNNRLEKKLEKIGSYQEKKRIQTEQETAELELHNLRRKNAKLEKKLSMSQQMLNIIETGSDIMGDAAEEPSRRRSEAMSPIPITLSEARIMNLERELNQLEMKNSKLVRECEELKDQRVDAGQSSELMSLKVQQLEEQLANEKKNVEELEKEAQSRTKAIVDLESELEKVASHGSGSGYIQSLQAKNSELEKLVGQAETKFRVKEKDLWSTIESQKKQIQEIEMEKLKLELGEEEEDLTDVEEEEPPAEPPFNMRERLMSLQVELDTVKVHNDQLQTELEKQSADAEEFLKTVESELESVAPTSDKDLRKELREKSKEHEDALKEIARLKRTISQSEEDAEGLKKKLDQLKHEHTATLHELAQSKSSGQDKGSKELQATLDAKTKQHEKALEEIKNLKEIITEQDNEIIELEDRMALLEKKAKASKAKKPISNGGIPEDSKLKRVQATGGVQLPMFSPKGKKEKENEDLPQLAPSLTPNFKKPPPAPKQKPSKEFLKKQSAESM